MWPAAPTYEAVTARSGAVRRHVDYCTYPPSLSADVEIAARTETETPSYIAGSAASGRYLFWDRWSAECWAAVERYSARARRSSRDLGGLRLADVTSFLSRLDEVKAYSMGSGAAGGIWRCLPAAGTTFAELCLTPALFAHMLPGPALDLDAGFLLAASRMALLGAGHCLLAILNWGTADPLCHSERQNLVSGGFSGGLAGDGNATSFRMV